MGSMKETFILGDGHVFEIIDKLVILDKADESDSGVELPKSDIFALVELFVQGIGIHFVGSGKDTEHLDEAFRWTYSTDYDNCVFGVLNTEHGNIADILIELRGLPNIHST